MNRYLISLVAAFGLVRFASPAAAQLQGPSSSDSPYIVPVAPGVVTTAILTVGDRPGVPGAPTGTYRLAGNPDGLGALLNGDGTFNLWMNHELDETEGIPRSHLRKGAFVSQYQIDLATLTVLAGQSFNPNATSINLYSGALQRYFPPNTTIYDELCSADLPPISAFSFGNLGTTERIFMNAEENANGGREFANIVTGPRAGTSWELAHLGKFRHENELANPFPQALTIVAGPEDQPEGGQIYFYVGQKRATGLEVERAGLVGGTLYGMAVDNLTLESRDAPPPPGTRFTLANLGDASRQSVTSLETISDAARVTEFLTSEDGAWDPLDPSKFYFNTADRYDEVRDGVGAQVGRSRLWMVDFDDITNPTAGGTITALLDGTEAGPNGLRGHNQLDNLATVAGADGVTRLILLEDVSGEDHNSRIWLYDTSTDGLTLLAQHDLARFGDIGLAATLPFNNDEESSGVIDARDVLGPGWFLITSMTHHVAGGELVWGGQLLAMYVPQAMVVPEPSTWVLGSVAGVALALVVRRRRKSR